MASTLRLQLGLVAKTCACTMALHVDCSFSMLISCFLFLTSLYTQYNNQDKGLEGAHSLAKAEYSLLLGRLVHTQSFAAALPDPHYSINKTHHRSGSSSASSRSGRGNRNMAAMPDS